MKLKLDNKHDLVVDLDEVIKRQNDETATLQNTFFEIHTKLRKPSLKNLSGHKLRKELLKMQAGVTDNVSTSDKHKLYLASKAMVRPYQRDSEQLLLSRIFRYVQANPSTELSIIDIACLFIEKQKQEIQASIDDCQKNYDQLQSELTSELCQVNPTLWAYKVDRFRDFSSILSNNEGVLINIEQFALERFITHIKRLLSEKTELQQPEPALAINDECNPVCKPF